MTVTALPGNIRLRAYQLGAESTFGTPVAATRRFPWKFAPTVDPKWTTPDVDTGTLDAALPPYRMAIDVTGNATGALAYNDLPYLLSAALKGGVAAGGGGPYTWTFVPAATSQDVFQTFTGEWGDDTTDAFRYTSGVLDKLTLEYPQDLGPVTINADYRFASVTYPQPITGGLSVDPAPAWVYAADTSVYVDSTAGAIGATKLTNTIHGATIAFSGNLDVKRFMNGSNTRFQAAGYARGQRMIETTLTIAKSTAGLAEVVNWLNASPVERFISVKTVSPEIAGGSTPYSLDLRFAGYWFTRSEATIGGSNAGIQLVCRNVYDTSLGYPISATVINSLSAL